MRYMAGVCAALLLALHTTSLPAQIQPATDTLRHPDSLEQQLQATDPAVLAREVELRGDPHRGALLFYRSAAACRSATRLGQRHRRSVLI